MSQADERRTHDLRFDDRIAAVSVDMIGEIERGFAQA